MRRITVENYSAQREYPRIAAVVAQVLSRRRYVAPVDVFLGLDLLGADQLARWRRGRVDYLERMIRCNLSKASAILRILRFHAHDLNLGPSITSYKYRRKQLRFSKTGSRAIEEAYSRHFVVIGKKNPFENSRDDAGTDGKSATRPESDSEGGGKPEFDAGGALPVAGARLRD